jgi:hypothetical protein
MSTADKIPHHLGETDLRFVERLQPERRAAPRETAGRRVLPVLQWRKAILSKNMPANLYDQNLIWMTWSEWEDVRIEAETTPTTAAPAGQSYFGDRP